MGNSWVNHIKEKKTINNKEVEVQYDINDTRVPRPTLSDAGKVLAVNEEGGFSFVEPEKDQLKELLNGTLENLIMYRPVNYVRPALANDFPSLKTVSLNGVEEGIGEAAFMNDENLTSIDLGIVNGEIGPNAFAGLVNVNHFTIDPESNITNLGFSCFSGLGVDRNSAERFVFDFRNSTFTSFEGLGTATYTQTSSFREGGSVEITVLGVGTTNADVYLPETVTSFMYYGDPSASSIDAQRGGSSRGVLNNCTNVDLWITGKEKVIPLKVIEMIPTDSESHIYIPNEIYGSYSIATNWVAAENLIDYIPNSVTGSQLPTYDNEGFEIQWYSDKAMTQTTTTGTGDTVYGRQTGTRLLSKVNILKSYQGTIGITGAWGTPVYNIGELIPVGTKILIFPKYEGSDTGTLSLFKVNGEAISSTHAALTVTSDDIAVEVYYNVPDLPAYFTMTTQRSYSPASDSNPINTLKFQGVESDLPTTIEIPPYYKSTAESAIYKVEHLTSSFLNDILKTRTYDITLPDTLIELPVYSFTNCSGLRTINNLPKNYYIQNNTFLGCTNLEDIGILSKEVKTVQFSAFGGCNNLPVVYYEGTPSDIYVQISSSSPESTSNKHFKEVLAYYSEAYPEDWEITNRWWHYVNGVPTMWEESNV